MKRYLIYAVIIGFLANLLLSYAEHSIKQNRTEKVLEQIEKGE